MINDMEAGEVKQKEKKGENDDVLVPYVGWSGQSGSAGLASLLDNLFLIEFLVEERRIPEPMCG